MDEEKGVTLGFSVPWLPFISKDGGMKVVARYEKACYTNS